MDDNSFFSDLPATIPEVGDICAQALSGEKTPIEAALELFKLCKEAGKEELLGEIVTKSLEDFVVRHEGASPYLNPDYMALLAERLQFDEDAPELRTGPLDEGCSPAVPVDTDSLNPAHIGLQLQVESELVKKQIKEHHALLVEEIADQENPIAAYKEVTHNLPVGILSLPESDIPTYKRGVLPVPVKSEAQASSLLKMDEDTKTELSWKALSTTQGRRSITPSLVSEAKKHFSGRENVKILETCDNKAECDFFHEWTVNAVGMRGSHHSEFSFVVVAAKVLCKRADLYIQSQEDDTETLFNLYIEPVNNYADRQFGWAIYIYKGKPGCLTRSTERL